MLLEYSAILVLWLVITLLDWAVKGVVFDILDIFIFFFLFFLLEFKFLEEGYLKKYLLLEIWKARCGVTYKNLPHNLWTWDGDSHSVHAGGSTLSTTMEAMSDHDFRWYRRTGTIKVLTRPLLRLRHVHDLCLQQGRRFVSRLVTTTMVFRWCKEIDVF